VGGKGPSGYFLERFIEIGGADGWVGYTTG